MSVKNGSKPGLAVLYDRASTAHQRNNWSRDDAARFLDKVVADHGYQGEIRQEIKSGENLTDRPVMKQLLEEITDGKVAALVTQDFTRLSRDEDGIDGRVIRQVCRDAGTLIITQDKVYDFANEGDDLLADVGFLIGKIHKRQSLLALTRGLKEKARQGELEPTYALYGFEWSERWPEEGAPQGVKPGAKKPGARLQIVPEEADIVRWIFDMYEEMSQRQVAMRLNAEGTYKPLKSLVWRRKTQAKENGRRVVVDRPEERTERPWMPTDVNAVITNPLYAGLVVWGNRCRSRLMKDFEGSTHHRPELQIVSQAQYNRCQRIMKERSRHPGTSVGGRYVFSGLIRCRFCGGRMLGKRQREERADGKSLRKRYHCRQYHQLGVQGCRGQTVYETTARKAVLPFLVDVLRDGLQLGDALREVADEMARPNAGRQREEHAAELAKIAAAQERLVDAVAEGLLAPEAIRRKQLDLLEKRECVEKRLASLERNQESSEEITRALQLVEGDLAELLENAPDAQLARLCQLVFRSFSVDVSGSPYDRVGAIESYECTAEFVDLLAAHASTPNKHTPPSESSVEGQDIVRLVLQLGSAAEARA